MKTMMIEAKTKPNEPTIIEGLPGLGSVGRIVTQEIIRASRQKE